MKTEFDTPRDQGKKLECYTKGIPVTIEEHVAKDIYGWARATDREVSGWFMVKQINGGFHVYKAFIPEQTSSRGLTTIHAESTANLYTSLLRRYGPDRYEELAGDLKGWWHSHVDGGVGWSGTDDKQAARNAENSGDWSLSIVVNHAGEYSCRLDFHSPVKLTIDHLPVKVVSNTGMQTKRNYRSDIKRWNHEPKKEEVKSRKIAVWSTDKVETQNIIENDYVNVDGIVMHKNDFLRYMECACGDNTCIDCRGIIKEYTNVH